MSGHGHFEKRCVFCAATYSTCRCIAPYKQVSMGVCAHCLAQGRRLTEATATPTVEPPKVKLPSEKLDEFEREVTALVNRLSLENLFDWPDFVIAQYLRQCLQGAFEARMAAERFKVD